LTVASSEVNTSDILWAFLAAGLSQKMPVGLQMIGNYWSESKLLNIAHQFQQQTDWHAQTP
jgi:aspartyl-tRNA(Asn)/glutamyl-tRNA(Gln) amidotransferase subunit A